jgi:hypothetical protein
LAIRRRSDVHLGHRALHRGDERLGRRDVWILNLVPLRLVPHYTAAYNGAAGYQASGGTGTLKFA